MQGLIDEVYLGFIIFAATETELTYFIQRKGGKLSQIGERVKEIVRRFSLSFVKNVVLLKG